MNPLFSPPVQHTDFSLGVCIVAPETPPYRQVAQDLQRALEAILQDPVEVLADTVTVTDGRHIVALGNMMDSAFLQTLYWRAYDLTDRLWPGPQAWAIRTVPYTLPGSGHVIILGVSRREQIGAAAHALTEAVEAAAGRLPCQLRVQPGPWEESYQKPARQRLQEGDAHLEQACIGGGSGDWDYMLAIAEIGMLALHTGEAELICMFCRQIGHFAQTRWFGRTLADPPMIHGFLRALLLPLAQLEHHPALPAALRQEALEALLGLYRSAEGVGHSGFLHQVGRNVVRQNHQTRSGLDLYYGGRYFHQVHGLAEGLAWMKLAETFFEPQLGSSKPVCDSWGHQWKSSLFNTADYALAAGRTEYFTSRTFLDAADRALMAHSNLETGPSQYLALAAAVTGNDEYLRLCRMTDEADLARRSLRQYEEPLRTWVTGRAAAVPTRLAGVCVAPLSRLFYDSIEDFSNYAPDAVYRRTVPYEQTFDKLSFRSGWSPDDDYLLIDGISGGSHAYQDCNCIVRYTSRGMSWLGGSTGSGPASVREYAGVSVAADGAGPGCEERYAALQYLEKGAGLSAAGTELEYPGLAIWLRHIVHCAEGWFLVIDEAVAKRDGQFLVQGWWPVLGTVAAIDGMLHSTQGDARLTMSHVGSDRQEIAATTAYSIQGISRWVQRSMVPLRTGEKTRFATLLWADTATNPKEYGLAVDAEGYRVEGEGTTTSISLAESETAPTITADAVVLPSPGKVFKARDVPPFSLAAGDRAPRWRRACTAAVTAIGVSGDCCWVGDAAGGVMAFAADGTPRWSAEISAAVRALAPTGDGGVVGGGDGETVHRFSSAGQEVWAHPILWQPMNWDNWSRKHCGVVSLAVGDIHGDGGEQILCGCADRHLYAFATDGSPLWRSPCQWGPPCYLALLEAENGGQQVLAGLADPGIFGWVPVYGADGRYLRAFERPDVVCWSIPSWSRCLRVADVNGDGHEEVISGMDTNHRQLIVYRRDGCLLWDADLGGAVVAIEAGPEGVYAGAANGFVQYFSGTGQRQWSCFLAAAVVGIAPQESGGCLVALHSGAVVGLDRVGRVVHTATSGAAITAATGAAGGLLVGRTDGSVEWYGSV